MAVAVNTPCLPMPIPPGLRRQTTGRYWGPMAPVCWLIAPRVKGVGRVTGGGRLAANRNARAALREFGFGYRGGDFYNPERDLRISSRNVATFGGTRRLFGLGLRAVRSVTD